MKDCTTCPDKKKTLGCFNLELKDNMTFTCNGKLVKTTEATVNTYLSNRYYPEGGDLEMMKQEIDNLKGLLVKVIVALCNK